MIGFLYIADQVQGFPGIPEPPGSQIAYLMKDFLRIGRTHFAPAYRRIGYQNNVAKGVSAAVVEIPGKPQPVLFYRLFPPLFCLFLKTVVKEQQFGAYKIKVFNGFSIMPVFIYKKTQQNHDQRRQQQEDHQDAGF
jgi:hypothetical protein